MTPYSHPGPADPNEESISDRARHRAQSAFRSMLLMFAVGFIALAVVGFIATKEVGVVLLVGFIYFGLAVCGWFGQRWLLRNIDGG